MGGRRAARGVSIGADALHGRDQLFVRGARGACGHRAILGDGSAEGWRQKAEAVKTRIGEIFWDEERGACFDRGPDGKAHTTLAHNTLRCMYWGSLDAAKAARFVREHLLNPEEFFTPVPLPSVAVNDPLFRNVPTNDWSGQPEGLTYQRAIRALENYGFLPEITLLGQKLFETLQKCDGVFPQQFDPFTGHPGTGNGDDYGPTMLALLEYVSRLYGVHVEREEVYFGLLGGMPVSYEQRIGNRTYGIQSDGARARSDRPYPCGVRITTDRNGEIRSVQGIDPDAQADADHIIDLGGKA